MNTNTIAIMNSKQQTNGNKLSSGYHSMTEFTSFNQNMFDTPQCSITSQQQQQQNQETQFLLNASPILSPQQSSLIQSPTNYSRNISVVDLNNRDTHSYLLQLMLKNQQPQQFYSNYSSNSSTPTSITSPIVSPQSPTSLSMSPSNRNQFFKVVNLKSTVMSQENFSQQLALKQYPINNETANSTMITQPEDNDIQYQQSVTMQSKLQQEQLKLQTNSVYSTSSVASSTSITNQNNMSGEETEEENEVLEESPEGRWSKRNEPVSQRDVPGIDQAFLAMDTEYGIEVVWNEIILSGSKKLKNKQDELQIDLVFENLINLNHPNIVKFHKHWRDKNKKPERIIFITEYMSSGSLKQFLRKAKRTNQPIKKQTWKRWCIQLLTALHYLHNCDPPIIHGDLSCDTIFIQHNGLIKIGSIAPDIVNQHVKTCIDKVWWSKNAHFLAPELNDIYNNSDQTSNLIQLNSTASTTAVDIYAFGMVALEMFNLELGGNGDTHTVTPELIKQSIEYLDQNQRQFINACLQTDPKKRPNAKELLFYPLLFEVPSLRLLAAHQIIKHQNESRETCDSDFRRDPEFVIATTNSQYPKEESSQSTKYGDFKYLSLTHFEANKYLEDVKNGIYPLTAFGLNQYQLTKKHSINEQTDSSRTLLSVNNEISCTVNPSLSPSNTSISGTNTSVANMSSNSSSSSTSPSQSLTSQVNIQCENDLEQNDNLIEPELANSMLNATATPQPQQLLINQDTSKIFYSSPSASPPPHLPLNLQPIQNIANTNGSLSRTQSPITTSNNGTILLQSSPQCNSNTNNTNNDLKLGENDSNLVVEKRHAEKMDSFIKSDKYNNYKLTLNITFDDKTCRFLESQINSNDTANKLTDELIQFGLVSELDKESLLTTLQKALIGRDIIDDDPNSNSYYLNK